MKIIVSNNTSSTFPLTHDVPNLGPRATRELTLTTHAFEGIKGYLDSLKSKNFISYSILDESKVEVKEEKPVEQPKNALITLPNYEKLEKQLEALTADYTKKESEYLAKFEIFEQELSNLKASLANFTNQDSCFSHIKLSNAVSHSKNSYAVVPGLQLTIPEDGEYEIVADVSLYSPVHPSKGNLVFYCFGENSPDIAVGTEYTWIRLYEDASSIQLRNIGKFKKDDVISVYWKAVSGVLRATDRLFSIKKVSK